MQLLCAPPFLSWRVASFWWHVTSGTFSTGVVACLAVVVWGAAGGLDTCSAELLSEVGDGNMKLREVLQGNEEL